MIREITGKVRRMLLIVVYPPHANLWGRTIVTTKINLNKEDSCPIGINFDLQIKSGSNVLRTMA